MGRTGGDTKPPRDQVPYYGAENARCHNGQGNYIRLYNTFCYRIGNMQSENEKSDEVEKMVAMELAAS